MHLSVFLERKKKPTVPIQEHVGFFAMSPYIPFCMSDEK